MKDCFLVCASGYNKTLTKKSIGGAGTLENQRLTKVDVPKCLARKRKNTKLFAKAESFVEKRLPIIVLGNQYLNHLSQLL